MNYVHGDATKVQQKLGWKPRTSLAELVQLMVVSDLELEGLDPAKYVVG